MEAEVLGDDALNRGDALRMLAPYRVERDRTGVEA